jgi:hypothetical protein
MTFISVYVLTGCGDPAPFSYQEEYFVTGYLFVGEPLENIIVSRSMPLADSFNYKQSVIKDADIRIISEGQTYNLVYRDSTLPDYHYPDSTVFVKPNTLYRLEIRLKDGKLITGETTTPSPISWVNQIPDTLYYPRTTDEMKNDTLKLSWTKEPNALFYLVSVRCLDTVNYGKFLTPPTDEKNKRISRPFENSAPDQNEITRWGLVVSNETPVVWTALKWYGLNEIDIFAPDYNFLRWFIQYTRSTQANTLLTSVNGAYGTFGSAARIKKQAFVIKERK